MKSTLRKIIQFPFHFALLSAYPVLALIGYNSAEMRPADGIRSLLLSLAIASLLFVLLWLILRSRQRAALLVSLWLLLFYSYGHVYNLVTGRWEYDSLPPALSGAWVGLAIIFSIWLARRKTRVRKATPALNIIALGLVIFTTAQIILWNSPGTRRVADRNADVQDLGGNDAQTAPDIYYIIVDSYGRSDLLQRAFDIDNSEFIRGLEALGFYVAHCTQSNYNRTDVSLASSLNLDYLQNLDEAYQAPSTSRGRLWDSISHSAVRADLESAGYRTVAFATGFPWSEIDDADVFYAPSALSSQVGAFEILLLRTTPLLYLEKIGNLNLDEIEGRQFRQRTELIFDSMDDLASMSGPKFVFIHIIPPHPPFIYAPDGTWTDPAPFLNEKRLYTNKTYTEGYRNQVEYISGKLLTAMRTLLEGSDTPPIIVLQGDHAPWLQHGNGKFMILNAYHLPGQQDKLYPTISPVNTFRLILDIYLGADYPLLEDTSYYSPTPNIYEFSEFPNPCGGR